MTIHVCCVHGFWRCTAAGEQEMSHRSGLRAETNEKLSTERQQENMKVFLSYFGKNMKKLPIDFVVQKGRIYQLSQQCMMLVDHPKMLTFLCSSLSNWRDLKWRPNGPAHSVASKAWAWIFVEVRLNMMEDRRYTYSIQSTSGSFLERTRCQSYLIRIPLHPKIFT